MINNDIIYWIALAHLPNWKNERVNKLIIEILHNRKLTLEDFFNLHTNNFIEFGLNEKEIVDLKKAKDNLPNLSFLAEDLLTQGFEIITINSEDYSKTLKNNLKIKYAPPLLYTKGNKEILKEQSIAIVGSRDANEISLKFTDNVAKKASQKFQVVVSGFAKGVDKQALDSAINYNGQSIIVLPQGILTYSAGIKKYYKQITDGNVLILSIFHPKAVWKVGLAMARNPIIYGLANDIYVAQSNDKGGTWSGVIDGLKKGRIIYVRYPEPSEANANLLLIEKGGIPVDNEGNAVNKETIVAEPKTTLIETGKEELQTKEVDIETKILLELSRKTLTAKQIITSLNLNWSTQKLIKSLKANKEIEVIKGKPLKFKTKNDEPSLTLFH